MTLEEWATAYVLRFGVNQITTVGYVSGEEEFIRSMCRELKMSIGEAAARIRGVIERSAGEYRESNN